VRFEPAECKAELLEAVVLKGMANMYSILLGQGDDLCENKFIGVQTHTFPRCIYDGFIYKLSVQLWKSK
jgi:hypothetical protein